MRSAYEWVVPVSEDIHVDLGNRIILYCQDTAKQIAP